jgi:hypothetical protein
MTDSGEKPVAVPCPSCTEAIQDTVGGFRGLPDRHCRRCGEAFTINIAFFDRAERWRRRKEYSWSQC